MIGGPHLVRFPSFVFGIKPKMGQISTSSINLFVRTRTSNHLPPPPKWQFFKCTPPPPFILVFYCVVRYVPKLVQILLLGRFHLIPLYEIRPAGANFQIRPFILSVSVIALQENDQLSLFLRMRAQIIHRTTKSSPKTYFNSYFKS